MEHFLWIIAAYLLGSIPFGLLFARTFCGIDPRNAGSGNVGSTNVARLCGKKWGAATLVCDVLKGALPVSGILYTTTGTLDLALATPEQSIWISLTALAAIMGHLFSCFLRFTGGKAVATGIGVLAPLAFWQIALSCLVAIVLIKRTGFVSLGSLTIVSLFPVLLALFGPRNLLPLALLITVFIVITHRANIRRLLKGEEQTWVKK